jgi:minor curlin subunit
MMERFLPHSDSVTQSIADRRSVMKINGIVTLSLGAALMANAAAAVDLIEGSEFDLEPAKVLSQQVATIHQEGYGNDAVILQKGGYNNAYVAQHGIDNNAVVSQIGRGHDARVVQSGAQLEASILQYGYAHDASIVQSGYGKEAAIVQHGSYGSAGIHQLGTSQGSPITVTQFARGRAAVQIYQY